MRVSHTGTQAGRTAIYPLSRTHTRVTRAERGQRASLSRRASRSLLTRACGIGFACREQLQAGAGARPDKGDLPVPPAGDRGEKVASARPASRTIPITAACRFHESRGLCSSACILHRDGPTGTATARRRSDGGRSLAAYCPPALGHHHVAAEGAPSRALARTIAGMPHVRDRGARPEPDRRTVTGLQLSETIFSRLYFHQPPLLNPLHAATYIVHKFISILLIAT